MRKVCLVLPSHQGGATAAAVEGEQHAVHVGLIGEGLGALGAMGCGALDQLGPEVLGGGDLGVGAQAVGELDGERLISHSGGQRKASTYLAVLPERGLAVAAMSNTAGAPMGDLARGALRLLLARPQ